VTLIGRTTAVAVSFQDVSSAIARCGWSVENDARGVYEVLRARVPVRR
jgi:hypothetical protein